MQMEKIVLLADALNFNRAPLDTAMYAARIARARLVGVLAEHNILDTVPSLKTIGGTAYVEEITVDEDEQKRRAGIVKKNIAALEEACAAHDVTATARHETGEPLEIAVAESRFADMIVADPSLSFPAEGKVPSKFILDLVAKTECPVLVSPEHFEPIEEVVLAYDGSRSAMFAIKQFCYLLPKLTEKRVVVLHISKDKPDKDSKAHEQLIEWLNLHFSKVSFLELAGDAREVLFEYFMTQNDKRNKLLVAGAYGRGFLSTFFRPSTTDLVMKGTDIPIFITHH